MGYRLRPALSREPEPATYLSIWDGSGIIPTLPLSTKGKYYSPLLLHTWTNSPFSTFLTAMFGSAQSPYSLQVSVPVMPA